jgi:hypothetical protein
MTCIDLTIDEEELLGALEALAQINRQPDGSCCRIALTEADRLGPRSSGQMEVSVEHGSGANRLSSPQLMTSSSPKSFLFARSARCRAKDFLFVGVQEHFRAAP